MQKDSASAGSCVRGSSKWVQEQHCSLHLQSCWAGYPAAVRSSALSVALFSVLVLLLFWLVRQRSCVQNQLASKDCSGKQCFSFKAAMKKWGKVCHTCLILFLSVTSVCFTCVKKEEFKYEGGGFFSLFFFWSNFSVICETMLFACYICFLTHLIPDQADLQSYFYDRWLITSTAELGPLMKGPWPLNQHLLRNSLCWVLSAEASPKVEGDFYLPKWEDNRRQNKDENLSSQLNLFRLISARGIQAAANPRFP